MVIQSQVMSCNCSLVTEVGCLQQQQPLLLAWELRALRAFGFDMVITPAAPFMVDVMLSYDAVAVLAKLRRAARAPVASCIAVPVESVRASRHSLDIGCERICNVMLEGIVCATCMCMQPKHFGALSGRKMHVMSTQVTGEPRES